MFGLCEMEMDWKVGVVAIGDSRIVGYLDGVKSLRENGILCVHVIRWNMVQGGIWYKLGYKQ